MFVKQLSVFVENKKGSISEILLLLGQNGINNIDIFFYIIMGISVSNYNVFLILDDI